MRKQDRRRPAKAGHLSRIKTQRPSSTDRTGSRPTDARLLRLCQILREQARTATSAQAELLATLSHDLRNPLSVIFASTRLLARAIPSDAPFRRHVDAATRCSEEINQILNDASDAAQAAKGELALKLELEHPASLVSRALEAAGTLCQQRNIAVATEIGADVEPVGCDADRVARVLGVLITNAVRCSPKGGRVVVSVTRTSDATAFSVQDTGPGIAPSQLAEVFAPPFGTRRRSRSTATATTRGPTVGASGLALAVAHAIIDAHGGRVWVESDIGRGSTFSFTLPHLSSV